jgi:drug/metabolite transporter (DMT)-like permease
MNPKLSLAIGIICIAFSPIFVKMAGVSALSAAFYRMLFAWVALAPYCLMYSKLRIDPKILLTAIIGGLVFALDIAVWNISLLKITATVSTLIANLAPVWVGVLSLLILKKRVGISFWLGALIAISGMCLLVGIENLLKLQLNAGVIYALGSSMLYAIYILITKDVLARMDTIVFMFYNMLAATVVLGIFCLINGDHLLHYSTHAWLRQAITTALLAWLLLGERVNLMEIVGGVMVLSGIGVTFVKRKSPRNN